jgi:ABC-type branched-subunit amino acid transport system substrate-binding protein
MARAVVALAGASLLVTACGAGKKDAGSGGGSGSGSGSAAQVKGDTTGINGNTIKIGTHMPLTGVAAPGYSEIPTGQKAYFDYVNANGGVCSGKKLELSVLDDGYNPTNTSAVTNQLVLKDQIFAMLGGLGTPTHGAVVDFLNENKVPDMFVSSGALAWNDPQKHPYTFGLQIDYTTEGKILGKYIKENFPNAKVGLFGQGDDFGRDGFAGAKQFLGNQVVAEATYTSGNTDVAPQISQLQQKGADLVVGFNVPAYTALSQLVALKLNYKPTWFYSNVGADPTLVGALLARFSKGAVSGSGALEGIYTSQYYTTVDLADNPWVQQFNKVWTANGLAGKPFTNFVEYGMMEAYALVQAIAADCSNLNRQSLVKTVEEKGKSWKGPWLAPLDYSASSHRGISGGRVIVFQGGKSVAKTKVETTDSGKGAVKTYDAPASTPPPNGIPTG